MVCIFFANLSFFHMYMHVKHNNVLFCLQTHIKILESAPENISLLLAGLGYLISISYVDDTEVFKVCVLLLLILFFFLLMQF